MTRLETALAGRPSPAAKSCDSQETGSFLETVTLGRLVAPVTEEEFVARYWEQKPLIIKRNNPGYYAGLFSLQDFDSATSYLSSYVKMAEATTKKNIRHQGSASNTKERILADMREGATLVLDQVHEYNPNLGLLCRKLAQQSGYRYQTNLYLTPPQGKGFTPHWDNHCVFILQVMGSKHWKVETERRVLPLKNGSLEEEGREIRGNPHVFTLEEGDMVYIPRGFVHAAQCGDESSLHITLGVHPSTLDELLMVILTAATMKDDDLRLALPKDFLHSGRDEITARVQEALRRMQNREFLEQMIDEYRNEYVKKFPLDISGHVMSFFQPQPLTVEDRVGPRDGIVYTIYNRADTVSVYIGTRVITFLGFFGEALNFALNTPEFAIRDLPGDLEDEERVLFAERLMQESMLVRKGAL